MRRPELQFATILAGTLLFGACSLSNRAQAPDDKAIVSEIQSKLFEDPVLKTRDIRVNSEKGVVVLTGTVNTDLEKGAAERASNQAKGVAQVIDQLTLAAPAAQVPPPVAPEKTLSAAQWGVRTPGPPLPMSTTSLADLVDAPRSLASFGTVSHELQQLLADAGGRCGDGLGKSRDKAGSDDPRRYAAADPPFAPLHGLARRQDDPDDERRLKHFAKGDDRGGQHPHPAPTSP